MPLTHEVRLTRLEELIKKMCHYTGQDRLLLEFDLKPWTPDKKDMTRWDTPKKKKD